MRGWPSAGKKLHFEIGKVTSVLPEIIVFGVRRDIPLL
jgi:hypothetical protein